MASQRGWTTATMALTSLASGTGTAFDLTDNAPTQFDNSTISRVVGHIRAGQSTAGGFFATVWFGLIIITQQSFNAGLSAIPQPGSNTVEADWMYLTVMLPSMILGDPGGQPIVHVDNRSQRRRPGTNKLLAGVWHNDGISTVQIIGGLRILHTGL